MADRYYDYNNGDNGDNGSTAELAKATRSAAVSASVTGDQVICVDGTHVHESGHFVFDDARIETSENFRLSTLQANTSETTRVARTSGGLVAANNPHLVKGFVFDGESGNSGAGVTQAFDIARDASEDLILQQHGNQYICGTTYGLLISMRRGRQELVNIKVSGTLGNRAIGATSSLSGDGNQVIDIQGCELDLEEITGSKKAIEFSQVNAPTNTLEMYFKGLRGTITLAASATFTLLDVISKDTMNVAGFDLTINADDSTTSAAVIGVRGKGSSYETSDANITNGRVIYNSPSGFAIQYGLSTTDSHITGGNVAGNYVKGKYYASNTPHNYVFGQGTVGEHRGNQSHEGYVGYLISITDSGTNVIGNLAFDCYGPNYYAKGVVAATIRDNRAVVTSKFTQRDRGILAVAPQGATDTTAVTFQENLVIVQDLSKIHSLAYIEDANQGCTFIRNTYIVDESQYSESSDYFSYQNGAGGAANNTLAEWNAQSEVTDDIIVPLPASQIAQLISAIKAELPGEASSLQTQGSNLPRKFEGV